MSKGKSKADGNEERIGWKDPREVKAFCDFFAAQVLDGKKHQGFLRKEGVDVVFQQLAEMGNIVTHTQYKNKWDHLKKLLRGWKECFGETGLGYDSVIGVMQATDEWWTRKIQISSLYIFARLQREKMHSARVVKYQLNYLKGLGIPLIAKNLLTPNVNPLRTQETKKPRKKRSTIQDMSDSLKSMSDVIVESRGVSTHNTPFRTIATNEMQAIMDMVLSLPGVQAGDCLYMFSTFFFINNVDGRNMFAANVERKEV
nr:hypothetical protein CFP56_70844 [Quercus suber]